jgi:hypothetical protein
VNYDAIVLGGGFYGCKVALALHNVGLKVCIIEPDSLMHGATEVNQARVHSGMHYPRFAATALSAAKHYRRFLVDHAAAMVPNVEHLYAIAKDSKTSPDEFERVAREIGAPVDRVPTVPSLFDPKLIEAVYQVEEISFNVNILREMIREQIHIARIPVIKGTGLPLVDTGKYVEVQVTMDKYWYLMHGRYVFNCTYANLDKTVDLKTKLKKEWVEVALCSIPRELQDTDITVMDGPYWSVMKYPPNGLHALTHVTHTPHFEWFNDEAHPPLDKLTKWAEMQTDAARFVPIMAEAKYLRSLWTTRVVLAQNEENDGRPILWEYANESPRVISILGSKFNSFYDAVDEIERGEWMQEGKTGVLRRGRRALVGFTGLVGNSLMAEGRWTDLSNSTRPLAPGHYDQIVCAAPSGTKWEANLHPNEDWKAVERLKEMLGKTTADEFILLSTIDALDHPYYNLPSTDYGRHRKDLERWAKDHFPKCRVIRLPGLFGPGLKKNLIYDLLHYPTKIHEESINSKFQWYPLTRLWSDIQWTRDQDIMERNIVTEAVTVRELVDLFHIPDWRSTYRMWHNYDVYDPTGYVMTKDEVLTAIKEFICQQQPMT